MALPPKLVAIDIDGTLLPSVSSGISPVISARNCRALREAESAGVQVVIATGRRQAFATPLIYPIGLKAGTVMITSNGTVIRTLGTSALGGEPIDRFCLPVETARELCPVLRRFGGTTVFTFDREGSGELAIESLEQLYARVGGWVEANREWIREVRPLESAFDSGEPPVQGMVCGTLASMRQAVEWLEGGEMAGKIEIHRTEYPTRDLAILDILPPGCSKGVALRRLAESQGLAREEIMAIGDNFNDLEMLEFVGQPVVMANAAPELLEIARKRGWRTALSNDQDGVARILESVVDSVVESVAESGVGTGVVQSAGEIAR